MKKDAKLNSTKPSYIRTMLIRERLQQDAKDSLRSKDVATLSAIRLIISEQKRVEIDAKKTLDDEQMIVLLDKMRKQRLDSIEQFGKADRQDLIEIEKQEISVIQSYLPKPLDEESINALVAEAIKETNANQSTDMGKVMAWLKPKAVGRVDMRKLSGKVKANI